MFMVAFIVLMDLARVQAALHTTPQKLMAIILSACFGLIKTAGFIAGHGKDYKKEIAMSKRKSGFLRAHSIKKYITETKKMRSSTGAVKMLIKAFDSTIEDIISDAAKLAKEDKRNTIMEQDVTPALEKHLGKKHLTWQETAEEVIRQNPTDLGKISKKINDYIAREEKKG